MNGNDVIEFEEKHHLRLHKAFLDKYFRDNKELMDDLYMDFVEQEFAEYGETGGY